MLNIPILHLAFKLIIMPPPHIKQLLARLIFTHLYSSTLLTPSPCPLTPTAINYLPQGEGVDGTAALCYEKQCQHLCLDLLNDI